MGKTKTISFKVPEINMQVLLASVLFIGVLLLSGNLVLNTIQERMQSTYDTGYEDGSEYGYDEGYKVAVNLAYAQGFEEGNSSGYAYGWNAMLSKCNTAYSDLVDSCNTKCGELQQEIIDSCNTQINECNSLLQTQGTQEQVSGILELLQLISGL